MGPPAALNFLRKKTFPFAYLIGLARLKTQYRPQAKIFLEKSHPLCYVDRMAGERLRKERGRGVLWAAPAGSFGKTCQSPFLGKASEKAAKRKRAFFKIWPPKTKSRNPRPKPEIPFPRLREEKREAATIPAKKPHNARENGRPHFSNPRKTSKSPR
jgi:hypothetical protein